MKAADISTERVLRILAERQGEWHTWFSSGGFMPTVDAAIPPDCPPKVVLAKFRRLIHQGLVRGCACGCRGDFNISDKGLGVIGVKRTRYAP